MNTSTELALVTNANAARQGIGAFNVVLLEHAEAIVAGAESAGKPVILQISQNAARYHGALEPIATASLAIARAAGVPAIVHLDHAEDLELVYSAVELGVQSVMFDGSTLDYEENVATTRKVVEFCHAHGVFVEAELGEVGGKDGVHAPGARSHPDEVAAFVSATGVDALAVAVGTSHAMTTRVATVDRELIKELAESAGVPLVLHGSSGLSDDELLGAVRSGMTKINISTHLNGLFTSAARLALNADASLIDPRRYIAPARAAMATEVDRLLCMLAP
ncbi:class II fructose-bisphosphate aldolase family protein [Arthrobacter gengyunqii]|uniref:Class II fructose-bisphosphate aldolase family protein n=1 Tax=Arthrobacter gengyunqii TaxID=2886940 RepID=A0A9X1M5D0_9MICC|nr:class II fructose-bisphosphate aldolase [Arthrobacter gengyunqii]MCC3270892.1 class II fructose-bisphosphate aldolase family protein [Arthrobacter gengyunqii]UOY96418.1 class II fructose-bisphosphate aldolase family protein [Arthrobacter gengyunqii]